MRSTFARRLCRDERGATAIEYGLIIGVVVVAMMAGISAVGETVSEMWGLVSDTYTAASGQS